MKENDLEGSHGMRVVHDGSRQAPPLLLVHGSGASKGTWAPVVPALAEAHHVIRVDLPGHGQSPAASSYRVPDQAARLAAVLDGLDLREVPLIGHSSGGYIATSLAEQRPDLVRSITLISSGPSLDAFLPQPTMLKVLMAPPIGPILWARRSEAMIRRSMSAMCHRRVDLPDDLIAEIRGISYRVFNAVLRRNTEYVAERSIPERLAALGIPVLAVFGDADPRWEPSAVRRYAAVPRARIELLPGVGHMPMLEAPESTARLLQEFVGSAR